MRSKAATGSSHSVQVYLFTANPEIRYLLLKRRRQRGGFWQPVTGRVEPFDETLAAAALREVQEETGFSAYMRLIDLNYAFRFTHGSRQYFEHGFGLKVALGTVQLSREHEDSKWVTFEEALQMLRWGSNKRVLRILNEIIKNQWKA